MTRIHYGIATPYGPLSREITEFVRETQPELLVIGVSKRARRSHIVGPGGRISLTTRVCAWVGSHPRGMRASATRIVQIDKTGASLLRYRSSATGLETSSNPTAEEATMTTNARIRPLFCRMALAALAILTAAPAAMADSPAYLFQDQYQKTPAITAPTAAEQSSAAAAQVKTAPIQPEGDPAQTPAPQTTHDAAHR